jgi:hypothetical protein
MQRTFPLRTVPGALLAAALILLAGCAPVPSGTQPASASGELSTEQPAAVSTGFAALPTATSALPQAVPTRRGPDLVASDPATVSLGSGGLQLVEFFRFT